jgi:hypothetical protein
MGKLIGLLGLWLCFQGVNPPQFLLVCFGLASPMVVELICLVILLATHLCMRHRVFVGLRYSATFNYFCRSLGLSCCFQTFTHACCQQPPCGLHLSLHHLMLLFIVFLFLFLFLFFFFFFFIFYFFLFFIFLFFSYVLFFSLSYSSPCNL